jgi:hypothetical protein
VTGQPGSGKSYVIETVTELCEKMKIGHVTTTSYNGMAAVNVDGNTICTTFMLNDKKSSAIKIKLSEKSLLDITSSLDIPTLRLLIIDEVSTIDAKMLALLDYRLQQLMQNNLPFGGILVILAGDFDQLGPVKKEFLPTTMMTYAKRLKQMNQLQNPDPPTNSTQNVTTPSQPQPVRDYNNSFLDAQKTYKT